MTLYRYCIHVNLVKYVPPGGVHLPAEGRTNNSRGKSHKSADISSGGEKLARRAAALRDSAQ